MIFKRLSIVFMVLVALLINEVAMARGGGRGHGGSFGGGHVGSFHGGHFGEFHHRGHGGFSFYLGSPFYRPSYYYPYSYYSYPSYYSSPSVIIPAAPPVYIEQETAPKTQPSESTNWAYCPNPQGYYPHVRECPAGWLTIAAQPVGQESGYWYYCNNPAGYYPYIRACSSIWQKVVP